MNEYPADFTISVIPVLAVVALLLAAVALALARPVAEALALAEAGHVSGNSVHCMVINRERTTRYSLDCDAATGTWTCTCPAYKYRPYRAGRTAHCKHTLARAIAERAGLIEN